MTTHNQASKQLITRQKRAIGALIVHGSGLIIVYLWAGYLILTQAAHPIQIMFFLSFLLLPLASMPLWHALQLYRGRYFRNRLQGWAGICLILGLYFLFVSIMLVPHYFSIVGLTLVDLVVALVFSIGLVSFLIVPSILILHLTGIRGGRWFSQIRSTRTSDTTFGIEHDT